MCGTSENDVSLSTFKYHTLTYIQTCLFLLIAKNPSLASEVFQKRWDERNYWKDDHLNSSSSNQREWQKPLWENHSLFDVCYIDSEEKYYLVWWNRLELLERLVRRMEDKHSQIQRSWEKLLHEMWHFPFSLRKLERMCQEGKLAKSMREKLVETCLRKLVLTERILQHTCFLLAFPFQRSPHQLFVCNCICL